MSYIESYINMILEKKLINISLFIYEKKSKWKSVKDNSVQGGDLSS